MPIEPSEPAASVTPARVSRALMITGVAGACVLGAALGLWARPADVDRDLAHRRAPPRPQVQMADDAPRRLEIRLQGQVAHASARAAQILRPVAAQPLVSAPVPEISPAPPPVAVRAAAPVGLMRVHAVAPPRLDDARPALTKPASSPRAPPVAVRKPAPAKPDPAIAARKLADARAKALAAKREKREARQAALAAETRRKAEAQERSRLAALEKTRGEARRKASAHALAEAQAEARALKRKLAAQEAQAQLDKARAAKAAQMKLAAAKAAKARAEARAEALAQAEAQAQAKAQRARAAQARGAGPLRQVSTRCAYADPGAALACADPTLGAAERQLSRAYREAEAAGVPSSTLERQQQRWLAARAAAAREAPWAVHDVYVARIAELQDQTRQASRGD
jgi:colicin import membrane protein